MFRSFSSGSKVGIAITMRKVWFLVVLTTIAFPFYAFATAVPDNLNAKRGTSGRQFKSFANLELVLAMCSIAKTNFLGKVSLNSSAAHFLTSPLSSLPKWLQARSE
jgi:ABC-type multidrug transport system permease subunit